MSDQTYRYLDALREVAELKERLAGYEQYLPPETNLIGSTPQERLQNVLRGCAENTSKLAAAEKRIEELEHIIGELDWEQQKNRADRLEAALRKAMPIYHNYHEGWRDHTDWEKCTESHCAEQIAALAAAPAEENTVHKENWTSYAATTVLLSQAPDKVADFLEGVPVSHESSAAERLEKGIAAIRGELHKDRVPDYDYSVYLDGLRFAIYALGERP